MSEPPPKLPTKVCKRKSETDEEFQERKRVFQELKAAEKARLDKEVDEDEVGDIRFKETADKMRDAIIGSHPNGALSFNSLVNLSGFNLLPMEQMKEVVDSWLAQGILVATSSRRNDLRVLSFQVNYNHDFWSDAITVNSSSESNDSVESDKEDEYDDDDDQDEGGDEIFDSLAEAQGDEGNVPVYVKRERVTEEDEKEEHGSGWM